MPGFDKDLPICRNGCPIKQKAKACRCLLFGLVVVGCLVFLRAFGFAVMVPVPVRLAYEEDPEFQVHWPRNLLRTSRACFCWRRKCFSGALKAQLVRQNVCTLQNLPGKRLLSPVSFCVWAVLNGHRLGATPRYCGLVTIII